MLRSRDWPGLFGLALFISLMAAGYYYNPTFVQLGLEDLARRLGLSAAAVARNMALLALLTCLTAIGFWLVDAAARLGTALSDQTAALVWRGAGVNSAHAGLPSGDQ
jgi:hypothetical protein